MRLFTHALTLIISVSVTYFLIAYAPLSWFPDTSKSQFGSSITTILGTDTISASRTTINNNFTSLNTGKFELSDWYSTTSAKQITSLSNLATVGTITSGVWNGTRLTVPFGGTGSTTLSQYQLLLGNGTSGVVTPVGWGSAGDVLTSAGAGALPAWSSGSINTALSYSWTGTNYFKNFNASSSVANPMTLNGVSYAFPTSQTVPTVSSVGTSTSLQGDGSGTLFWGPAHAVYSAYNTAGTSANNGYATTTLITLPAGLMNASSTLQLSFTARCQSQAASQGICNFYLRTGTGQTFGSVQITGGDKSSCTVPNDPAGTITMNILPNGSVSAQQTVYTQNAPGNVTCAGVAQFAQVPAGGSAGTSAITLSATTTIALVVQGTNANGTAYSTGISLIVNQ